MTINIPSHLTNITIIDQMYKMMVEYNKNYGIKMEDVVDYNKLEEKSYDYINDMINIIFPDNDSATNNYISNLFYQCKGTLKVFDLIEEHLGLEYAEPPEYDIDSLTIKFESVSGTDLLSFNPALINFLNTLLYFNDLSIVVNIFKLNISSDMSNKSSNTCVYYKKNYFEFK